MESSITFHLWLYCIRSSMKLKKHWIVHKTTIFRSSFRLFLIFMKHWWRRVTLNFSHWLKVWNNSWGEGNSNYWGSIDSLKIKTVRIGYLSSLKPFSETLRRITIHSWWRIKPISNFSLSSRTWSKLLRVSKSHFQIKLKNSVFRSAIRWSTS